MSTRPASLDVRTDSELARLVDEVQRTGRPRLLRRDGNDVAILMPLGGRVRWRSPRTPDDALTVVERTAGIFKKYARNPPPTPREEKDAFEQAVADEVMDSMRG